MVRRPAAKSHTQGHASTRCLVQPEGRCAKAGAVVTAVALDGLRACRPVSPTAGVGGRSWQAEVLENMGQSWMQRR